jgi:hypothetical protein
VDVEIRIDIPRLEGEVATRKVLDSVETDTG